MKISGSVNKTRVQKTGMTVIARGLKILVESGHGAGGFCPCARLRSRRTVIKVVIDSDRGVVLSLYLWHRQGPHFGLGEGKGNVSVRAAVTSAALFLALVAGELIRNER